MGKVIYYIMHPKHLSALLLLIVALTSTFSIYLPNKFDTVAIYLPQLIMCLYAIMLFALYWKKAYRPKATANRLLFIILGFIIYYIFITGYRFISGGDAMQSLYVAIVIFTSAVLFFLIDADIIDRKEALTDLIVVFTIINIMQGVMGFVKGSVRLSPVLQNIMVYDCIMLFMVPCFFYVAQYTRKLKLSNFWGGLCWTNLLLILILIISSGSRSGTIMLVVTYIVCMVINFERKSRFILKCIMLYVLAAIIIVTLYSYNLIDFKTAVMRQKLAFLDVPNEQTQVLGKLEDKAVNAESDNEKQQYKKFVQYSITSSDEVRTILWDKSIQELKKDPLWGTGTMLFEIHYIDSNLLQGSHNIILETSLAFGVTGMIIFFIMTGTPVLFILLFSIRSKSKKMIIEMLNYMVAISNVFIMAMVQPVLVMAFPVMLSWLITGIMYKRCIEYSQQGEVGSI